MKDREYMKNLLAECKDNNRIMFIRMYAKTEEERKNPANVNVNEVVDLMEESKIKHAITQIERTLEPIFKPKFDDTY